MEKGDRVLIRNLSQRGGTGKMRSFWEDKMHMVTENLNSENICEVIQVEDGSDYWEKEKSHPLEKV